MVTGIGVEAPQACDRKEQSDCPGDSEDGGDNTLLMQIGSRVVVENDQTAGPSLSHRNSLNALAGDSGGRPDNIGTIFVFVKGSLIFRLSVTSSSADILVFRHGSHGNGFGHLCLNCFTQRQFSEFFR